jgi:hypothetical protein
MSYPSSLLGKQVSSVPAPSGRALALYLMRTFVDVVGRPTPRALPAATLNW